MDDPGIQLAFNVAIIGWALGAIVAIVGGLAFGFVAAFYGLGIMGCTVFPSVVYVLLRLVNS